MCGEGKGRKEVDCRPLPILSGPIPYLSRRRVQVSRLLLLLKLLYKECYIDDECTVHTSISISILYSALHYNPYIQSIHTIHTYNPYIYYAMHKQPCSFTCLKVYKESKDSPSFTYHHLPNTNQPLTYYYPQAQTVMSRRPAVEEHPKNPKKSKQSRSGQPHPQWQNHAKRGKTQPHPHRNNSHPLHIKGRPRAIRYLIPHSTAAEPLVCPVYNTENCKKSFRVAVLPGRFSSGQQRSRESRYMKATKSRAFRGCSYSNGCRGTF
jgi:hypothetical protein